MKVIAHGRRPGERRQRTTYDKDGRVLIPGTRERNRITLDSSQPAEKRAAPAVSKAAPAPKPDAPKAAAPAKSSPSGSGKLFPGMRRAETTMAAPQEKK